MKFVIPTSRKFTCELIATDPCLRLSKYWGSWSCHSKSKQNISINYSSIPSLEIWSTYAKNSLKSVLWFVVNMTYAEKKSVDGILAYTTTTTTYNPNPWLDKLQLQDTTFKISLTGNVYQLQVQIKFRYWSEFCWRRVEVKQLRMDLYPYLT